MHPVRSSLSILLAASFLAFAPIAYAAESDSASDSKVLKFTPDLKNAKNDDATKSDAEQESKTAKPAKLITDPSSIKEDEEEPSLGPPKGSSTSLSDFSTNPEEAARSIAQSITRKPTTIPGISGTVQIRRPFKLFAREELLHNLSFRDTPVKEVIAELARRGNLNIIIDKSVVGKITGELKDLTLNEAMDSVLAAAGLQSRILDNNTVVVGSLQAMVQLGLNRPMARVFKLSYAHPYDVATLLHVSIFNRGMVPDFNTELRRKGETQQETVAQEGGGTKESDRSTDDYSNNQINKPDIARTIRGTSRSQTQEGVGFNNAAVDPGTQQIRTFQEVPADYAVDQNGGSTIVVPDVKNRQILVVGTVEDLKIAEEAIRLLDRRPRQVHVQTSLVELTNQGIRQLAANVSTQGSGLSASILGNAAAPLVRYLPGLGGQSNNIAGSGYTSSTQSTFAPSIPFGASTSSVNQANNSIAPASNSTTNFNPANAFSGLVGAFLPAAGQTIAGVTSTPAAASGFNLLTLGGGAGGKGNIATLPSALNISLNMLLQTNKAKLIANPSVVVVDNTESLITLAEEVVHKVTSTVSLGVVTTNVELTKAGIFLNVLPKVAEDGFITMRLRPQVSTPLGAPIQFGNPNQNPTVVTLLNIRDIMSQEVRIKDGQTLVLGGLFTENEASILAKVPYLAETPVLGALFRNSLKGRDRTELMLLITPKIVEDDPSPTQITDKASPLM